ncbi:MAG: ABC transporter permease [Alphaproteobacteria bacterium]|nr:ABC transporter permease [Alphaproteobacteria bacterium]
MSEHRGPSWVRLGLEVRQNIPPWQRAILVATGLLAGLVIGVIILFFAGVGLGDLYTEFVVANFTNPQAMSAILVQSAPLLIAGLAAAAAFRVRFWNIGIEGQMIFGSIACTFIAKNDIGPESLRLPLMLLAAAVGGMAWIAVPGFLRLRLGLNEIISTLLLNYVALNFLLHLLYGSWQDPKSSFPHSEQYQPSERLPLIGWENLTLALPLALLLAIILWWLMERSRFGFFTRFAEANPKMARAVGIPLVPVTLAAILTSGALAGASGFAISAGIEYRMTQSFFIGYGFSGILIAFLARNNPIVAIPVSLLLAVLFVTGQSLQVFYQIPGAMVQLIQAIIVMSVAGADFFIRHRIRLVGRRPA